VRGVVKAEVIDNMGTSYVVSRTIESSKEKKRFKTLDSTVTKTSKDKKQVNVYFVIFIILFCKSYILFNSFTSIALIIYIYIFIFCHRKIQ